MSELASAAVDIAEYDAIISFFDDFAEEEDTWIQKTSGYHLPLTGIATSFVPEGQRVLEVGCGRGDLLAQLRPSYGVGVDVSARMIETARRRHPDLTFVIARGEELELGETFDYIVLWDLVPYVYDIHALFTAVVRHCHPRTRILISTYSNAWRPLLTGAARLGLRPKHPFRNWVAPRDLANLVDLAGLEVVTERKEVLAPTRSRTLARILNGLIAHMPMFRSLDMSH